MVLNAANCEMMGLPSLSTPNFLIPQSVRPPYVQQIFMSLPECESISRFSCGSGKSLPDYCMYCWIYSYCRLSRMPFVRLALYVCAVIISAEAGSLHISRVYALHSNPLSACPYIWVRCVLKAIEQMFFILMKLLWQFVFIHMHHEPVLFGVAFSLLFFFAVLLGFRRIRGGSAALLLLLL